MESPETFSSLIAWSIAIGATLFTILTGAVLFYHWSRYSFNKSALMIALLTYSSVSILILVILFNAAMRIV